MRSNSAGLDQGEVFHLGGVVLVPVLHVHDAVLDGRVGHHVDGDLLLAPGLLAADLLQDLEQTLGVVAGIDQELQAELVGLHLVVATEGELGRRPRGLCPHDHGARRPGAAGHTEQHAGGRPGQARPSDLLGQLDLLGDVAAVDMRNFMREDAGQFLLLGHGLDQTGVDEDVAGRGREGIVRRILDHVKVVSKRLLRHNLQNPRPDPGDIAGNIGVLHHIESFEDDPEHFAGEFILLPDGDPEPRTGGGERCRQQHQHDPGYNRMSSSQHHFTRFIARQR